MPRAASLLAAAFAFALIAAPVLGQASQIFA